MNYDKMLQYHKESQADATIAVLEVSLKEASRFGIMNCDENDVIYEFEEKPKKPKSTLASMGIYIFTYKTLRKYLIADDKNPDSHHDFGKDIIPAYLNDNRKLCAYRFKGYWKDVGTVDSLWESNMDLLKHNNELDLGDPTWKIYTEDVNALPQYIGEDAEIENSYITQGSVVLGSVKNSVLGTNCQIGKGAVVVDSVIQPGAKIGEGAKVTRCIVADDVEIAPGAICGSADSGEIELVAKKYVE
jgi:glucose-1-phosphate adenylyltransferase